MHVVTEESFPHPLTSLPYEKTNRYMYVTGIKGVSTTIVSCCLNIEKDNLYQNRRVQL